MHLPLLMSHVLVRPFAALKCLNVLNSVDMFRASLPLPTYALKCLIGNILQFYCRHLSL